MNFEPGQHVLCISEGWFLVETQEDIPGGPRHGSIYVVTEIRPLPDAEYLVLAEFPQLGDLSKPGFDSLGFRPLQKTQTDISVFTAMLTKYPAGRPVKATPRVIPYAPMPTTTPVNIANAIRNRQLKRLLDQLEKGE